MPATYFAADKRRTTLTTGWHGNNYARTPKIAESSSYFNIEDSHEKQVQNSSIIVRKNITTANETRIIGVWSGPCLELLQSSRCNNLGYTIPGSKEILFQVVEILSPVIKGLVYVSINKQFSALNFGLAPAPGVIVGNIPIKSRTMAENFLNNSCVQLNFGNRLLDSFNGTNNTKSGLVYAPSDNYVVFSVGVRDAASDIYTFVAQPNLVQKMLLNCTAPETSGSDVNKLTLAMWIFVGIIIATGVVIIGYLAIKVIQKRRRICQPTTDRLFLRGSDTGLNNEESQDSIRFRCPDLSTSWGRFSSRMRQFFSFRDDEKDKKKVNLGFF